MQKKCLMKKEDIVFNLERALASENNALESYRILESILKDEEDKTEIAEIVNDEIRHIEIVKKLIEIINNFYQE